LTKHKEPWIREDISGATHSSIIVNISMAWARSTAISSKLTLLWRRVFGPGPGSGDGGRGVPSATGMTVVHLGEKCRDETTPYLNAVILTKGREPKRPRVLIHV
jgi:hypothetical protein